LVRINLASTTINHQREVSMSPKKEAQKPTMKDKQSKVFSEEERAMMRECPVYEGG
jgi:hypothetical protein